MGAYSNPAMITADHGKYWNQALRDIGSSFSQAIYYKKQREREQAEKDALNEEKVNEIRKKSLIAAAKGESLANQDVYERENNINIKSAEQMNKRVFDEFGVRLRRFNASKGSYEEQAADVSYISAVESYVPKTKTNHEAVQDLVEITVEGLKKQGQPGGIDPASLDTDWLNFVMIGNKDVEGQIEWEERYENGQINTYQKYKLKGDEDWTYIDQAEVRRAVSDDPDLNNYGKYLNLIPNFSGTVSKLAEENGITSNGVLSDSSYLADPIRTKRYDPRDGNTYMVDMLVPDQQKISQFAKRQAEVELQSILRYSSSPKVINSLIRSIATEEMENGKPTGNYTYMVPGKRNAEGENGPGTLNSIGIINLEDIDGFFNDSGSDLDPNFRLQVLDLLEFKATGSAGGYSNPKQVQVNQGERAIVEGDTEAKDKYIRTSIDDIVDTVFNAKEMRFDPASTADFINNITPDLTRAYTAEQARAMLANTFTEDSSIFDHITEEDQDSVIYLNIGSAEINNTSDLVKVKTGSKQKLVNALQNSYTGETQQTLYIKAIPRAKQKAVRNWINDYKKKYPARYKFRNVDPNYKKDYDSFVNSLND
tara:strand:+ start:17430 stop:19214 length:1785 start_codon:yes stop_codon:yes gene_type:complete